MAATIINVEPENEKQVETAPIEDLGKPEQPEQVDKAPQSKFADKSRDEVEKMLTDAQEMIGRQSQEVKDARVQIDALRKTDNFINQRHSLISRITCNPSISFCIIIICTLCMRICRTYK